MNRTGLVQRFHRSGNVFLEQLRFGKIKIGFTQACQVEMQRDFARMVSPRIRIFDIPFSPVIAGDRIIPTTVFLVADSLREIAS